MASERILCAPDGKTNPIPLPAIRSRFAPPPRTRTLANTIRYAARCAAEALEARRLLSVVPNATLYQEWLAAPADFKAAVVQLESRYPNFAARFASDLEFLSGTFVGPVQFASTIPGAQPALASPKTAKHHAHPPAPRPKPAPRHRKPHRGHRDDPPSGVSVTAASYDWTHASHTLTFTFSANVSASLVNSGALTVLDLSTGNTIAASNITLSYNGATNTATYSIPYTQVPDGVYQATLSGSLIYSGTLHLIGSDSHPGDDYIFTNNFFFVTGDLNHDGYNNFTDLNTLAQYYGATNATYAQGDINHDGTVGFTDLLALEQTYHETVNLPVPGGLSSPTQTPTTALLVWQAANSPTAPGNPTASGYNVYRTTTVSGTQSAGLNVPSTAFLDTGLAQQTNYSYTLRTTDAAADISLPSHPAVSVTTPAPSASNGGPNGGSGGSGNIGFDTPPDAPTNLATSPANSTSDNAIAISWSPSQATDVVSYLVTRNGVPVGGVNANTHRFTDSGLTARTSYIYGVTAFDSSANQSTPATVTGTAGADVTAPSAVVNPSIVSVSSNSVELSWTAATDNVGVDHYVIMRGGQQTGFQQVGMVGATPSSVLTYTWTDMSPPTPDSINFDLEYTVIAVDAAGNQSSGATIAVPLGDLGEAPGQVISDSKDQYIPQAYEDYFFNDIDRAFRQLLTPPQSGNPFPAPLFEPGTQQHWYDDTDPLITSGEASAANPLVTFQQDRDGFYPSNHVGDSSWRISSDPRLIEDQRNPVYYAADNSESIGENFALPPVWLDNNNDATYDAGDTIIWDPNHQLWAGEAGRNSGISSYAIGDFNHLIVWFDGNPSAQPVAPIDNFRSDFAALYTDIDKLAALYPDPRDTSATRDTLAGLLASVSSHSPDAGVGTISIAAAAVPPTPPVTTATLIGGSYSQFRLGDSIEIGGAWYPLDINNYTVTPSGTTITLAQPYIGGALQNQSFSIRNWTLMPDASQQAGSYFPSVSYVRGQPNASSIIFPAQFSELAGVLTELGQNPDSGASMTVSQLVSSTPIPLTSELDYTNVVPDTNVDGLVQVPQDWTTPATDTGFIALAPNRTAPQVYLPLAINHTTTLPVHVYLSQGGFAAAASQPPLLTKPLFVEGSFDSTGTLIDAAQKGVPLAYSLDTSLQINLYIVTPSTHIKRLEVVRPQGNSVVFDFPWNAQAQEFSEYGAPLSGYTQRGDDRRGYVLREMPDNTYRLEFPSGVIHEFGFLAPPSAVYDGGFIYGYGGSNALADSSTLVGVADEQGDQGTLTLPGSSTDILKGERYTATLLWNNGQLSGVKYQSQIDPTSAVTTTIGYLSDGYGVASLTKTSVIGGQSDGTIADWSYTLLSSNTLALSDPADVGSAEQIGRSGSFVPGSASTVTLATTIPGIQGSRTEAFSYNSDGLLASDQVTLVEPQPDGTTSSSSATTSYQYQTGTMRYGNGAAPWDELAKITFPDNSWQVFQYDDGSNGLPNTGWLYKIITPFKSSQWNNDSNNQKVVQYSYDALRYASSVSTVGLPADSGAMTEFPRETTSNVVGTETSDILSSYSPLASLWYVPYGNSVAESLGGFAVVQRQAPSAAQSAWGSGQFQSTTILNAAGYELRATPSVWELLVRSAIPAYDYGLGAQPSIAYRVDTFILGNIISESSTDLNYFGDTLNLASYAAGIPAQTDTVNTADQDPLGRVKHMTLPAGLSSSDSFTYSGNNWWGPSSTTNPDGSTTTYVYTTLGQVQSATTAWGTSGRTLKHEYTYDAAGNVVTDKETGTDEGAAHTLSITTAYAYDALGRLTKQVENSGGTDATANRTTAYNYTFDSTNNQNLTTITLPGGATEVKRYYLDGTLASDTGTAITPTTYDEGVIATDTPDANGNVETAGSRWTKVSTDGGANYTTTYTNMLGQQYLVQQSGPGTGATAGTTPAGSYADRVTTFDANDRPYKVTDFDSSKSFVIYDPLTGQPAATIADLNGDGTYEPNVDRKSIDHLSPSTTVAGTAGTDDTQGLSDAGSNDSYRSDSLIGPDPQHPTNFVGEDRVDTENGLKTETKTPPPTGPGDWVGTTTNPDQTQTVDTYTNGLLTQEQTKALNGSVLSTTTNVYDALGRLSTSTDWSGTTAYGYFQDGTPKSVQNPNQSPQTVNTIDALTEQPTTVTRPDTRTDTFTYNSLGELASQTGAGLLAANFSYDAGNTGNLNGLTTYTSGVLNGSGPENTSWAFDLNTGQQKTRQFADGSTDTSLYNLAGDPAGVTLPGISTGTIGYNTAGEPTSQSLTDSTTGVTSSTINQQDDIGRPVITTDADNGKTFSTIDGYTPLGDLRQEIFGSAGNSSVGYAYFPTTSTPTNGSPDALQTMTVTPASGSPAATGYTYDTNTKQLKTITANGTTFTLNYLNQGTANSSTDWVSSVQAGNVTINWAPQSASGGLLASINATGTGGANLYSANYSYLDGMNRRNEDVVTRTNVSDAGTTSTESSDLSYGYNAKDFLYEVDDNLSGLALDHYTYDGAGNQTATSLGTANSVNQYLALTYNGRGDVAGDGTYTFGYDANDRLISITPAAPTNNAVQVKYGYDGQGRRLWKDVYSYNAGAWSFGYSVHYLWNGTNLAAELDGNNNLRTGYTWGPNGLLAVTDYTASGGPKTYVAVNDASGNLVEYLDPGTGTVAASFHYDPWGKLISSSGPAKNIGGFRGKGEFVDSEFPTIRHALHRDDENGIWLERDPAGEIDGGPNLYEQYNNDPINYSDRTGLAPGDWWDPRTTMQLVEAAATVAIDAFQPYVKLKEEQPFVDLPARIALDAAQGAANNIDQFAAQHAVELKAAGNADLVNAVSGTLHNTVNTFDERAIVNDVGNYAQAGLDSSSAALLTVGRRVPVARSVIAGFELADGLSLAPNDFGSSLTGSQALNRGATILSDSVLVVGTAAGLDFSPQFSADPILAVTEGEADSVLTLSRQDLIASGRFRSGHVINPFAAADKAAAKAATADMVAEDLAELDEHDQAFYNAPHGNSLQSLAPSQGYTLRSSTTGEILKYGETTQGTARYSQRYLRQIGARMYFETEGSKAEMYQWQHEQILRYKAANGGARPPLNGSDY